MKKAGPIGFASGTLIFAIAFLFQMSDILKKHACWCDFKTPPAVGEVVFAMTTALGAIACAIGLDVRQLLRVFGIGGMDRITDRSDTNSTKDS